MFGHFIGRVTKDVVLEDRNVGNETVKVCNFNVAENFATNKKDQQGKTIYRTEYHRVTLWRRQAEALAPYLKSGKRIFVEGEGSAESWVNNAQQIQSVIHFSSPTIKLLDGPANVGAAAEPTEPVAAAQLADPEDLPFA